MRVFFVCASIFAWPILGATYDEQTWKPNQVWLETLCKTGRTSQLNACNDIQNPTGSGFTTWATLCLLTMLRSARLGPSRHPFICLVGGGLDKGQRLLLSLLLHLPWFLMDFLSGGVLFKRQCNWVCRGSGLLNQWHDQIMMTKTLLLNVLVLCLTHYDA